MYTNQERWRWVVHHAIDEWLPDWFIIPTPVGLLPEHHFSADVRCQRLAHILANRKQSSCCGHHDIRRRGNIGELAYPGLEVARASDNVEARRPWCRGYDQADAAKTLRSLLATQGVR